MRLFEFTVSGPPVSHQSRNKARLDDWRKCVRAEAAKLWGNVRPLTQPLRLAVTYYHEGEAIRIDNDNMLKPIQDALNGLVYLDDRLITDVTVRKTSIDGFFRIQRYESLVFLAALSKGDEFLHVVISSAPDHETLLK
jgi:crossover junction endodeoxyribonuclease RusA